MPVAKPKQTGPLSVLDRIKPIEKPTRGIRMAMYGRSGSGKTTLACDFPKPLLFIRPPDDDGRLSVYKMDGIDDIDIRSTEELQVLSGALMTDARFKKYKTVVVDNASALQELVLKRVLKTDELPAQLGWGVATQQQWGEVGLGMKELLRDILALQSHVIVLAQERNFDDDNKSDGIAPTVNCALSPTVAGWLGPSCDYLVQTFVKQRMIEKMTKVGVKEVKTYTPSGEYDFCLRTGPHDVYSTKFRVPKGTKLPAYIVDPSYAKIAALINGKE